MKDKHPQSQQNFIPCLLSFCEEGVHSEGLCFKHHINYLYHVKQWNVKTIAEFVELKEQKHRKSLAARSACAVDTCCDSASIQSFCERHYKNYRYYLAEKRVQNKSEYINLMKRTGRLTKPLPIPNACVIHRCSLPSVAKGLCRNHYQLYRRAVMNQQVKDVAEYIKVKERKDALNQPLLPPSLYCAVETCSRPVRSKGLCSSHYQTYRIMSRNDQVQNELEFVKQKNKE